MFSRMANVSEECMNWLEKSSSSDVKPEQANKMFVKECNKIQEDVLRTLTTASKEPASADGKTEVVVEVRLAKAEMLNTMMVVTRVYAIVYTKKNRKYYVTLDKYRRPKKVFRMSADIAISINGDDHVEVLKTIESKTYRISM